MIRNSTTQYGQVAKLFHWLMAILFIGMFIVAYIMINIPKSNFRMSLYDVHKATGMLLFGLLLLRLVWRLINPQPDLSKNVPFWQRLAAKINMVLLYLLMILMPFTGFLTSTLGGHDISFYGLFVITAFEYNTAASQFFADAHEILSYVFIASFVLHVLGAIFHHYFLRDDTFKKMWL